MKRYTIVRNGVIARGPQGDHYCGFPETDSYPYRAEVCVHGNLTGPDFFIVENSEMDAAIQLWFRNQATVSCEKMADEIVDVLLTYFSLYDQWSIHSIKVELTGTNGRANLSCEWLKN